MDGQALVHSLTGRLLHLIQLKLHYKELITRCQIHDGGFYIFQNNASSLAFYTFNSNHYIPNVNYDEKLGNITSLIPISPYHSKFVHLYHLYSLVVYYRSNQYDPF